MRKILLTLGVVVNVLFSSMTYAQAQGGGDAATFADDSIKDITIIAGIAGGGALLGLSTLSFVEEPSEHLNNVVVGGAIGIIIGVAVVAYGQANKSQDLYEEGVSYRPQEFNTNDRALWHVAQNFRPKSQVPTTLNYSFSF